MARSDSAADAANPGRLKQIALTYKMTRKADKKIGLVLAGVFILILGVFLAIGFLIGHPVYLGILGFLLAFLGTAIIFGRRAERAAFGQMEGQPGAAAAVLDNIGRGWTTTPAVAMKVKSRMAPERNALKFSAVTISKLIAEKPREMPAKNADRISVR